MLTPDYISVKIIGHKVLRIDFILPDFFYFDIEGVLLHVACMRLLSLFFSFSLSLAFFPLFFSFSGCISVLGFTKVLDF